MSGGITEEQRAALARLAPVLDAETYLAGGVAIAIELHHRTSLDLFARKYPVEDAGHAVRSLAYFGDADAEPLPRGLDPAHWLELKAAWGQRVKAL